MKKNLLFAAIALTALAGCSDNSFVGDESPQGSLTGDGSISFNMKKSAITRADKTGSDAATDLNSQFIIWGEKNESDGSAASAGNLVFKNYIVRWTDNSAYTSTSNTKNWEYVGYKYDDSSASPVTTSYSTNITPNTKGDAVVEQTIKYWDYNASSYTFTAVSAKPADITDGKVVITKNTSGSTVYDKGYDIAIKTGASVDDIFVSDRNQPTKNTNTDRNATNQYGGNVTMTFRNFMSKIRFGIYETIPGYKVKITNVDYNSTSSTSTNKFGVDGKFLIPGANTAYTISYYTNNKATVKVKDGTTPNSTAFLETAQSIAGSPILHTTPTKISESPVSPTYDKTDGAFTTILPFPSNDGNMKVKMDFTLTSEDTGETISVVDATAEIPAAYCQWLPNYAYTYILKLNDNTNGQIGGVTGLYPITFDAIEVVDENGVAEYITTVSEPSITTFGVKGSVYSTEQSDYATATDVYATVMDASSLATLSSSNFSIYDVTSSDPTNFPVTEASVAEALIEGPTWTKDQADLKKITCAAGPALTFQNTVPAEDGTTKTLHASENKAAKFTTGTSGKKYAIVFKKTAATYNTDSGKNDYTSETFTAAGTLYTDASCTTVAESWTSGTTYYKRTAVTNKGVYAIKIVTVQ